MDGVLELYGVLDAATLAGAVLMAHTAESGDLTGCGLRDYCVRTPGTGPRGVC